jgi:HlyD family secretion protein
MSPTRLGQLAIPLLALAGVGYMLYFVVKGDADWPVAQPIAPPARSAMPRVVVGAGLVEASTRNREVGSELSGVVVRLMVEVGEQVAAGDTLLMLDDRAYRAELRRREANLLVAEKNLERLRILARSETLEQATARLTELTALAEEAVRQNKRFQILVSTGAVSKEEADRRASEAAAAKARRKEAAARLKELQRGGWEMDVDVAVAEVEAARTAVEQTSTDLDRIVIRAPVAGEILQINTRVGEYINNFGNTPPPVIMGDTTILHVRTDIDENDAWRLDPTAPARATLRGNSEIGTPLTFVRIEPYVIPKVSLTGRSSERVDTRVLQVLYSFPKKDLPVLVGQQMDVFIEAK